MILTVVFPHLQKAQWERIDEEFKDVEYEIIIQKDIQRAINEAKGRFILFMQEDSAFEKGELAESLNIFLDNSSYRKLAMVASGVDFDSLKETVRFSADDGKLSYSPVSGDSRYPVQIGYLYGSIIRTSAIKNIVLAKRKDAIYRSVQLSDFFWSTGLRIEMNPLSVYYAPSDENHIPSDIYKFKASSEALKVWNKEFIP